MSTEDTLAAKLVPANDYAILVSDTIWENRHKFATSFVQRLRRETKENSDFSAYYDSDISSAGEQWSGSFPLETVQYTAYNLDINDMDKSILGWRIGNVSPELEDQDQELSILVSATDDNFDNIGVGFAVIKIHPLTGVLMIECTNEKTPIQILEKGKWETLFYPEMRTFNQKTTPVQMGPSEFVVVVPDYDDAQYAHCISARDEALTNAGQSLPDSRLYGLPRQETMPMIGSTCVHGSMGCEDFGWNSIGVSTTNGEPVIVQDIRVDDAQDRAKIMREAFLLLIFSGVDGLYQATEIRCEHGYSAKCITVQAKATQTLDICSQVREKINIASPLPVRRFSKHNFKGDSIPTRVQYVLSATEGLSNMHDLGWIHGNIDPKVLLITSENRPEAVLCNLESTVQDTRLLRLQQQYTKLTSTTRVVCVSKDVDTYRFIVVTLMNSEFSDILDPGLSQRIHDRLDRFAAKGNSKCKRLATLLGEMLVTDADDRGDLRHFSVKLKVINDDSEEYVANADPNSIKSDVDASLDLEEASLEDVASTEGDAPLDAADIPVIDTTTFGNCSKDSKIDMTHASAANKRSSLSAEGSTSSLIIENDNPFEYSLATLRSMPPRSTLRDLDRKLPIDCELVALLENCKSEEDRAMLRQLHQAGSEGPCVAIFMPVDHHKVGYVSSFLDRSSIGKQPLSASMGTGYSSSESSSSSDEESTSQSAVKTVVPRKRSRAADTLDPGVPDSTMTMFNKAAAKAQNYNILHSVDSGDSSNSKATDRFVRGVQNKTMVMFNKSAVKALEDDEDDLMNLGSSSKRLKLDDDLLQHQEWNHSFLTHFLQNHVPVPETEPDTPDMVYLCKTRVVAPENEIPQMFHMRGTRHRNGEFQLSSVQGVEAGEEVCIDGSSASESEQEEDDTEPPEATTTQTTTQQITTDNQEDTEGDPETDSEEDSSEGEY